MNSATSALKRLCRALNPDRHEVSADRRSARMAGAFFGLFFLAAGYLDAFPGVTEPLMFAGIGMMVTALLLWAPAPTVVGASAGPIVTIGLLVWLWLVY